MMNYSYYNDIERYPCEVLRKNIGLGLLPEGYVDERDIREIHATDFLQYRHIHLFAGIGCFPLGLLRAEYPSSLRTLTAGFPCQDISAAGRQEGIISGQRSSLWKEIVRLLQEYNEQGICFDYLLIENVRNLLSGGDWQEDETQEQQETETQYKDATICSVDSRTVDATSDEDVFRTWMGVVLADLAECGYDAEWTVLSASDFGAPHQRKRVFIVAYPSDIRSNTRKPSGLAHASSTGQQKRNITSITTHERYTARRVSPAGMPGKSQSRLGRDVDGSSDWLDKYRWPSRPGEQQCGWEPSRTTSDKQKNRIARLKALGNAIVVPCVEYIARRIVTYESTLDF